MYGLYAAGIGMHFGPKGLTPVTDIVGRLLFGIGLALSGYFPGSIWMALGEGRRDALYAVGGAWLGAAAWTLLFETSVGQWVHNVIDLGPKILAWNAKPPVVIGISPVALFGIAIVYGAVAMFLAYIIPRYKGGKKSCLRATVLRLAGQKPSSEEMARYIDTTNYLTEGGQPYTENSMAYKVNNYYAVADNVYGWVMVLVGAIVGLTVVVGIMLHQIFGESTTDSWLVGYLWLPTYKYSQIVFKTIGWEPLSDIGTFLGAFFSAVLISRRFTAFRSIIPPKWRNRFGDNEALRALASFTGAFLMLFGARMANGCASGHILSGSIQMADSGLLFGVMVLASAIATAKVLYGGYSSEMRFVGKIEDPTPLLQKIKGMEKALQIFVILGTIATVVIAAVVSHNATTYAINP